jgi:hypothetical protein
MILVRFAMLIHMTLGILFVRIVVRITTIPKTER